MNSILTYNLRKFINITIAMLWLTSAMVFAAGEVVTQCDILASRDNDPNKVAPGVSADDVNLELAEMACKEAVTNDPTNPRLQFEYGRVFWLKEDYASALTWLSKAADQNYGAAQYYLGDMYNVGLGVKVDRLIARDWYEKSANQNYSDAQFVLGQAYIYGNFAFRINEHTAFTWMQKAADQNHGNSLFFMGYFYHNGYVIARNEAKALEFWHKALANKDTDAYFIELTKVELLFSWAETQYPAALPGFAEALPNNFFPPPYDQYQFRQYTDAGNDIYLAYDDVNKNLYYYGPLTGNQVVNLGSFTSWYEKYLENSCVKIPVSAQSIVVYQCANGYTEAVGSLPKKNWSDFRVDIFG